MAAWWWLHIVLFVILVTVFLMHKEPVVLTQLKQKYAAILGLLRSTGDATWSGVLRPALITGMKGWNKTMGPIGSNVNKGYEIYICLDGNDVNSALYVLIHELAHMSVPEYDHTSLFWDRFTKLKNLCIQHGIYTSSGERGYCGDTIRD